MFDTSICDQLMEVCELERIVEQCAHEFDSYVDRVAAAQRIYVTSPIFEGSLPVADIPKIKHLMRNATRSRALFYLSGPPRLQPLPLSEDEHNAIIMGDDPIRWMTHHFSNSQRARGFDRNHPSFFDYVRGVVAEIPEKILDYEKMLRLFPPKKLPGLEDFHWRPLPLTPSQWATEAGRDMTLAGMLLMPIDRPPKLPAMSHSCRV
jgi:hypothetical protein